MNKKRIILTSNVKDFRPLIQEDSPGVIGIPDAWSSIKVDTKVTALLRKRGLHYFKGCYRALATEDARTVSKRRSTIN